MKNISLKKKTRSKGVNRVFICGNIKESHLIFSKRFICQLVTIPQKAIIHFSRF